MQLKESQNFQWLQIDSAGGGTIEEILFGLMVGDGEELMFSI